MPGLEFKGRSSRHSRAMFRMENVPVVSFSGVSMIGSGLLFRMGIAISIVIVCNYADAELLNYVGAINLGHSQLPKSLPPHPEVVFPRSSICHMCPTCQLPGSKGHAATEFLAVW